MAARHQILSLGALVREEGVVTDLGGACRANGDSGTRVLRRLELRQLLARRPQPLTELLDERAKVSRAVLDGDGVAKEHGRGVARTDGADSLRHVADRRKRHPGPLRPVDAHHDDLDACLDCLAELGAAVLVLKKRGRKEDDELARILNALQAARSDLVIFSQSV